MLFHSRLDEEHPLPSQPDPLGSTAKVLRKKAPTADQLREVAKQLPEYLSNIGIRDVLESDYVSSKFKALYKILKAVPKGEKTVIFVSCSSDLGCEGIR